MVLALLGKLLGSSLFGTIFGGVMGLFNQKQTLKSKAQDYAHDIEMRKLDNAAMDKEWGFRLQGATLENEARADANASEAFKESYKFAEPEQGTRMAAFNSFVRPFITLNFFAFSVFSCGFILFYSFFVYDLKFSPEQMFKLLEFIIDWITFMASLTIGYFFGSRPSKPIPSFRS